MLMNYARVCNPYSEFFTLVNGTSATECAEKALFSGLSRHVLHYGLGIKDGRKIDGAAGTGGMLTVAEERIREVAEEYNKSVSIHLYGQEVADETYAIAKSDMLVKGEGGQSNNIFFGSTISNDGFAGETFDFCP